MKKIILSLTILSATFFANNLLAQACTSGNGPSACSPTGGPAQGGFEDPSTTPCAVQGVAYSHAIQFTMFSVFNYLGTQQVDSIQFTSIDNLPCGLCWAVNKASKTYSKNEDGCISISGTTNDAAGQYKLALALKAWINGSPIGLPIVANVVNDAGIKLLLRVKTPTGACVTADTSSSATNLTASINCTVGINEITGNISSLNLVPNPMNSTGTLSFISEKQVAYTLSITDVTGKVISVKHEEAKEGVNNVIIERNNLSPGIYFLSLSDGKNIVTNRFAVTE